MDLQELIVAPAALPSIPRVITLVLEELNKDNPELNRVSSLLAEDPVMTAKLLRIANSARYQLGSKISTPSEALAILGMTEVRGLAYAAALSAAFSKVGGVNMEQFWRYSLNTAKLTRALFGLMSRKTSMAYTLGLVHAAGELVMHLGMPAKMARLDSMIGVFSPQRAIAEIDFFGYSYAQVGAEFARAWNLPEEMSVILDHQVDPYKVERTDPLAAVLHLAVWRSRTEESGYEYSDIVETFPDDVAHAVRLNLQMILDREPIQWTSPQEAATFA